MVEKEEKDEEDNKMKEVSKENNEKLEKEHEDFDYEEDENEKPIEYEDVLEDKYKNVFRTKKYDFSLQKDNSKRKNIATVKSEAGSDLEADSGIYISKHLRNHKTFDKIYEHYSKNHINYVYKHMNSIKIYGNKKYNNKSPETYISDLIGN